jgi:hypothetical protein
MSAAARKKIDERKQKLIDPAKLAAKVQGCACTPTVRLREWLPQVYGAEVVHEHWCPVVSGAGQ